MKKSPFRDGANIEDRLSCLHGRLGSVSNEELMAGKWFGESPDLNWQEAKPSTIIFTISKLLVAHPADGFIFTSTGRDN